MRAFTGLLPDHKHRSPPAGRLQGTCPAEAPLGAPAGPTQRAAHCFREPAAHCHALLAPATIAVVAALRVRVARSGLGQTATDEIGAGDDGHVEPRLAGAERVVPAAVSSVDHRG